MPDIKTKVAEKLATSGPTVLNTIVDALVQSEINSRVETANKGLKALENLEKELAKINKPDNIYWQGDTKIEAMTDSRRQSISKSKEKIANLTKALDTALETNTEESYKKLSEVVAKSGTSGGSESKSEAKPSITTEVTKLP